MPEYKCSKCEFVTKKKCVYNLHLKRKNPCNWKELADQMEVKKSGEIVNKIMDYDASETVSDDDLKCRYCNKEFLTKGNVIRHIKDNCEKVKEIEKSKQDVSDVLRKLKSIEEENLLLKSENIKLKKSKGSEEEILLLKSEIEKLKKLTPESSIGNNNIIDGNNNVINNITNNITIANYDGNSIGNLSHEEFLKIFNKRLYSVVALTEAVHFNPKYPQFHNVYIPSEKEKYGKIYENGSWRTMLKDELVDKVYDNKRDCIISRLDDCIEELSEPEINAVKLLQEIDALDKGKDAKVMDIKEKTKLLMSDKSHFAKEQKSIIDKQNKIRRRKVTITQGACAK